MSRMPWRIGTLACAVALVLAGCVAGPDYRVPDAAVAERPDAGHRFVSGVGAAFSQANLPDHWWELYDDSRLNAYVREALQASTDLRSADANLRRASAQVLQVQAERTIQTDTQALATYAHVGRYTLPGTSLPQIYALGVGLSYPLDLAGGIQRSIEAAHASEAAVEAVRDQVKVVVAAAVTRAYMGVCSANRTLAANQQVLDTQRATLDAIGMLVSKGRGTDFDITRARAAVNVSAAAIPQVIAQRQAALFEMAALLGRTPANYPKEMAHCANPPALKNPIPIGDGWQLIRRRPDIRAAERNLAAATAIIGVETAKFYPQVSIGASIGAANSAGAFFSSESFGAKIGPLLSWQWPNRNGIKARVAAAGAQSDAAFAAFDGAVVEALKQAETALSTYAQEVEREHKLAKARDDAAHASEQANRLFRFGRVSFIDVLSAEATLANTESSLASSRAQLIDRQIDLFLALGGGWGGGEVLPENSPEKK